VLIGAANAVGLLSEEYDTGAGRLVEIFPQAFSHVALIKHRTQLVARNETGEATLGLMKDCD
jgi:GH15 family glucan-1,4-alpha-glucosidase